jgi:hypothetical protein
MASYLFASEAAELNDGRSLPKFLLLWSFYQAVPGIREYIIIMNYRK